MKILQIESCSKSIYRLHYDTLMYLLLYCLMSTLHIHLVYLLSIKNELTEVMLID